MENSKALTYFEYIDKVLKSILREQIQQILQCAEWFASAVRLDRLIYIFGTGHSHMLAEEAFYRAGGLVPVAPILESSLMLHEGASKSTDLERLHGYAKVILNHRGLEAGDVLVVASNSGRNPLPVELAIEAKNRGVKVIAMLSLEHANRVVSRHASGKKLYEVADIILDNKAPYGDAVVSFGEFVPKAGPVSTITGCFILNCIIVEAIGILIESGEEAPVFVSSNIDEGDKCNYKQIECFKRRIQHL